MPMNDEELDKTLAQMRRAYQRQTDEFAAEYKRNMDLHNSRVRESMDRVYYEYIGAISPEPHVIMQSEIHAPAFPFYVYAIVCSVLLLLFVCLVLSIGVTTSPRIVVPYSNETPTVQVP